MEKKKEFCNIQKMVSCIDGIYRSYDQCIGYCNNICHKGFITAKLLKEHKCLSRGCTFLDPMNNHMYWINLKNKEARKAKIKENKDIARMILEKTKESSPADIELVMCQHLYDSTYILIAMKTELSVILPHDILKKQGISVYVKFISNRQRPNIQYTYEFLLPENMRDKLKRHRKMAKERT